MGDLRAAAPGPSRSEPPLGRRVLGVLRAGAVAGLGSAATAFALAFWPDGWVDARLVLWTAATLSFALTSAWYARLDPSASGWRLLLRTLLVLLAMALFGGALVGPGLLLEPTPRVSYFVMLVALAVFFVVVTTPPPRVSEPTAEDGPGGLLPAAPKAAPGDPTARATFALTGTGPAVAPEEIERDELALEVRVLWGADVLSVRHLEPPRTFRVGDLGADLVVDPSLLGATHVPLVVVLRGVTVLASSGDAFHSRPRVPLEPGAKVMIVLPSSATPGAYRAVSDGGDVPIAIEVALVRAGRRVGRGPVLPGARWVAACVLAASCVLGVLAWAAKSPGEPEDEATSSQVGAMARMLQAADVRQGLEPASEDALGHDVYGLRGAWDGARFGAEPASTLPRSRSVNHRNWAWRDDYEPWSEAPYRVQPPYCDPFWSDELDWPCSPFVLRERVRRLRWPRLLVDENSRESWFDPAAELVADPSRPALVPRPFGPHGTASRRADERPLHIEIREPTVQGGPPLDGLARTVRQAASRVRLCGALARKTQLDFRGTMNVVLWVEGDGVVGRKSVRGDYSGSGLAVCIGGAFWDVPFPPPPNGVAQVTVPIDLGR